MSTEVPMLICGCQSRCAAWRSPRASRTASSRQLLVELDADLAHMPRLLVAEQVAGAADVEVVARAG